MRLQKIPHDTTRYTKNPIELMKITDRLRIGKIVETASKISPTMTANNAPLPYVASAVSTYTTYYPYCAFDDNIATNWNAGVNANGCWIKLYVGTAVVVSTYKLMANIPGCTLEGSNDDSNWIVLDTRSSGLNSSGTVFNVLSFINTIAYSYYRLTNIGTTGWVSIISLELYSSTQYHNYIGA